MTEEIGMECPQCSERTVRVDMPPDFPESTRLEEIILETSTGETIGINYLCSSCGFRLERSISIEESNNDRSTEALGIDVEEAVEKNSDPDEL